MTTVLYASFPHVSMVVFLTCALALPLLTLSAPMSSNNIYVTSHNIKTKSGCLRQPKLACQLQPTDGNTVEGTVTFSPQYWVTRPYGDRCGVLIVARVHGLSKGHHGFHIHTYGDIRRNNGKLAGGHFSAPYAGNTFHGLPTDTRSHWGDMGNLYAWGGGNAAYRRVDFKIRIMGILGRSIVVHAGQDKGASFQPSGDSGSRQAHCVIGIANPDLPTLK